MISGSKNSKSFEGCNEMRPIRSLSSSIRGKCWSINRRRNSSKSKLYGCLPGFQRSILKLRNSNDDAPWRWRPLRRSSDDKSKTLNEPRKRK